MSDPTQDLNQIIISAVNGRIEAEVAKALAGDEVVGKFVTAALTQEVEHRPANSYRSEKVTYLHKILLDTIQDAAKQAVAEAVEGEKDRIRALVKDQLEKRVDKLADGLVDSFAERVRNGYGVELTVTARGE